MLPDRCVKQHPYDSLLLMLTVMVDYGNGYGNR